MKMKNFGFQTLVAGLGVATALFAGNERSGGTPPPPIILENPLSYQCQLAVTQVKANFPFAARSRATLKVTIEKGNHGNHTQLSEITTWEHFKLRNSGPISFITVEEPIAKLPEGGELLGNLQLRLSYNREDAPQTGRYRITLHSVINPNAEKRFLYVESQDSKPLDGNKTLNANVKYEERGQQGNMIDQRNLTIFCQRLDQ